MSDEAALMVEPQRLDNQDVSPANELVEQAEAACRQYADAIEKALEPHREREHEALRAVYALTRSLSQDPKADAEFRAEHEIKRHGNAKNPWQPIVRHFLPGKAVPALRVKASEWAGAVLAGISKDQEPDAFIDRVRSTPNGAKGVYREYIQEQAKSGHREALKRDRRSARDEFLMQQMITGATREISDYTADLEPGQCTLMLVLRQERGEGWLRLPSKSMEECREIAAKLLGFK